MTEEFHEINCLGLKCPLPVLRLEKAMRSGKLRVKLIADDPVSVVDIPLAAQRLNAQIHTHKRHDGAYEFVINAKTT